MIRFAVAVMVLWLIAGCATLSGNLGESDESRKVVYLIGYTQDVAAMRPEAQRRELNDASQTYVKDRDAYASLRLALLLSLPGTPFFDDTRAAGLLEPYSGAVGRPPATGPLRQFAVWLHAQIGERMREQHKASQFKEQLDALRAIERTLNERGQGRAK